MKWLNITALILQYFAFWFAAPELLGANTLKRFENTLRKVLTNIPIIILGTAILGYGITFFVLGVYKGIQSQTEEVTQSEMISFYWTMGICTLLYFIGMIYFKKIKSFLQNKVAIPVTKNLIENNDFRSTSLVIGAVLFSIGFLMQLIALIVD